VRDGRKLVVERRRMTILASVEGAAAPGEKIGLVALALLAAAVVLLRPPVALDRTRAAAMLSVAVLAPVLLAIDVWSSSPLHHLRAHPALAAAVLIVGIAAIAGLAALFTRWPAALPLAAVAMLPFRVPVSSAGTTANLLLPLYAVVAAGVLAYCLPRLRASRGGLRGARARGGGGAGLQDVKASPPAPGGAYDGAIAAGSEDRGAAGDQDRGATADSSVWMRASPFVSPRSLEWLLMASIVLYAIQAAYSYGFSKALQNVVFFYVPFALMFCLLREVRWTRQLLLRCAAISVLLAALFAGIGFVEYARKSLLLNPTLVAADVYGNYFRVNSAFYDPNIYGRYLALVMLLLATAVLQAKQRREVLLCAAALAWLWAGLITSISQTSMIALLAGLAVLAGARWGARRTLALAATLAVLAVLGLLLAPSSLHFGLTGKGGSVDTATSGRSNLVRGGLDLFADRPVLGFGAGSFAREYRLHQAASVASSTSASHTAPITVAAEQGIVGLLLYVLLVACSLCVLFRKTGRGPPPFRPKPGDTCLRPNPGDTRLLTSPFRHASPFRLAIAACFVALLVHTLAYADFLEDPIAWALLAIGIALARVPEGRALVATASASGVLDEVSCSTT
jgi:O-antigen ligase